MINLEDYIKKYKRKPIKLITGEYSLIESIFIILGLILTLALIILYLK